MVEGGGTMVEGVGMMVEVNHPIGNAIRRGYEIGSTSTRFRVLSTCLDLRDTLNRIKLTIPDSGLRRNEG